MFRLLLLLVVTYADQARLLLRDELRHEIQDELKQQRIHAAVQAKVNLIQFRLLEYGSVNFTLFCLDPNVQYRNTEDYYQSYQVCPMPTDYATGVYALTRDGPRYRYSVGMERYTQTELIWPRPYCDPKYGYDLYQRLYGPLEDTPDSYAMLFFQKLNFLFPYVRLTVSTNRPSEGPYETDCCPLYTVSADGLGRLGRLGSAPC